MDPALWNHISTSIVPAVEAGIRTDLPLLSWVVTDVLPHLGWLAATALIVALLRTQRSHRRNQEAHIRKLEEIDQSLKLAEHALNSSRERLQQSQEAAHRNPLQTFAQAFRSSSVALAISSPAEDRFLDVNDCFLGLCGHDRNSVIGHTSSDLALWPDPHQWLALLQRLETEPAVSDVEMRLQNRDGQTREVITAMARFEVNGQRCLITVLHDISDRKATEADLRHSEERFQLIARATNDTVWDWNLVTNQIWWNEGIRTIFGYTAPDLPTEIDWWHQAIHDEDRDRVLSSLRRVLDEGERFWSAEYRLARQDGFYADVLNRAYLIQDANGRPVRMLGALMDITERKRFLTELAMARDAAVEALRLKSEFLANISHEVRTPLNGIVGMTVLMQDTELDEEQANYVDTIQSSTDALLTIINDILDFSKIEAGKVHFEALEFDLRATIDSTIEMLADRAQSKHIELVTLIDGDVPDRLRGDSGRLRQVVTNLVVNALKFTEEGEVVVQISRASETDTGVLLMFVIRDTGIGIPREALPYLFQAFSQVDGSTTRKHGGTGLGLTISKQLVELMGGQIGVESTPGEGSTFWFTCRLEKQPGTKGTDPHDRTADFAGCRVLVADHHGATRQLLLASVSAVGANGVAAGTGQDVLRCLRQASSEGRGFDLAVLDRDLKDPDDTYLVQTMKDEPALKTMPVLLIVPRSQEEDTTLLRSTGAAGLISRPLKQRALTEAMARLLGAPSSHQTRFWLDRRPPRQAGVLAPLLGPPRAARILVAEDNPINQRVAIALLEKLGYRAQAVATGAEVLRAIEAVAYDIILMDCQLPEIDGFEATREIRRREPQGADAEGQRTYIIAMTAFAQTGARERCLASGMDDFVSKPIRIEVLTAALRKALEGLPPHPGPSPVALTPTQLPAASDRAIDPDAVKALKDLKSELRTDPVGEMVSLFVRQAPACLEEIELSLTRYEARSVEKAAHSLKGSASTMGAHRLADLCATLEEEAHKGSLQVAAHLLNQARVEYLKVKEELLNLPRSG